MYTVRLRLLILLKIHVSLYCTRPSIPFKLPVVTVSSILQSRQHKLAIVSVWRGRILHSSNSTILRAAMRVSISVRTGTAATRAFRVYIRVICSLLCSLSPHSAQRLDILRDACVVVERPGIINNSVASINLIFHGKYAQPWMYTYM